jgi:hypothetical protein
MIRQAHSYLAGAVSGAALIAAAVVVFILLLVSTQAFKDWPIALSADNETTQAARQPVPRIDATQSRPTAEKGVVRSEPGTTSRPEEVSRTVNAPVEVAATGPSPTQGSGSSPPSEQAPSPTSSGDGSGSTPTVGGGSNEGDPSIPSSPVNTVTDVVDETVSGANDTLNRTVDRTVDAVRGLLGGDR